MRSKSGREKGESGKRFCLAATAIPLLEGSTRLRTAVLQPKALVASFANEVSTKQDVEG